MTIKQKELCNVIESLPEELSNKVVDNKDLLNKLKKGMEDTKNRKVCTVEEAFEEVKGILAN